jgi:hypothetical protein
LLPSFVKQNSVSAASATSDKVAYACGIGTSCTFIAIATEV